MVRIIVCVISNHKKLDEDEGVMHVTLAVLHSQ